MINRSKSLTEITGIDWGPPPPDCRELVRLRHELRRKPIAELTDDDLARLVEITVDSEVVVPLVLERLLQDPLILGLLCRVLRADTFDWRKRPELVEMTRQVVGSSLNEISQITDDLERTSKAADVCRCWAWFERNLSAIP
jgi:hypothetical protein